MSSSMSDYATSMAWFVTVVAVVARDHFLGWVMAIGGARLLPSNVGWPSRLAGMTMRTNAPRSLRKYLPSADAVVARTGRLAGKDTR